MRLVFETAGVVVALTFVASPSTSARPKRRSRPSIPPGPGLAHPGLGRGARSRGSRSRPRCRAWRWNGARVGSRAGRVRGHAGVRRVVPGHHADGAARDRRARKRLHSGTRPVGGPGGGLGGALLSVKLVIGRGAGSRATEPILDASAPSSPERSASRARHASRRARRALPGAAGTVGRRQVLRAADDRRPVRLRRGRVECGDHVWPGHRDRRNELHRSGAGAATSSRTTRCSPQRLAQRRVRAAPPAAGAGTAPPSSCSTASASALADARPATPGRRAPALPWPDTCLEPSALLLDELLGARRQHEGEGHPSAARAARRRRGTTVLVTHDFDEAAAIAEEVAGDRGREDRAGSARSSRRFPVSAFVADLTGAVVLGGVAVRALTA